MKKIFILALVLLGIQFESFSQATWVGNGTTNNFSDGLNWTTAVQPSFGVNVIFDGTSSKNCNFDVNIDVANFSISAGYTGTINALATNPVISGNFSQAGGTFISTSESSNGMIIVGQSMSLTGGTFLHNNGRVTLVLDPGTTTISGNLNFNILAFADNGSSPSQRNVDFGTSSTASLVLDGGNKLFGYQGAINVTSNLEILGTNTSNPATNSGTITFTGAGPISITGAASSGRNKLPNLVFNTSGAITMSGHIGLQGNWTGTSGALSAGTSTTTFFSSASILGSAAAFHNFAVQSAQTITFPANEEVVIGGNIVNNGNLTFPTTTTLGLNGSSNQSISGVGFNINCLQVFSGARTINLNTGIFVFDFLDINGSGITFAAGNFLTLKSTAALTARVGELSGTSTITGNVTVETVIPGGSTGWTVMGVRGVNSQQVTTWDYDANGGTSGVPMTCIGCFYDPSAVTTGWFKSIQGWDETNINGYDTSITNITDLTPGKGFWVYVGDGFLSTNDLTLINTGTLKTGVVNVPISFSGPQSGFCLVANPYPSPISWDDVMLDFNNINNVTGVIYAFNADAPGYTSYANGVGNPGAPNGLDDVIAGGQGFYVEAQNGGTLDFFETNKVTNNTSANPLIRAASTTSVGQTFRIKLEGALDKDVTTFRIHGSATSAFDKRYDAKKLFQSPGYVGYPGAYDKYTTISSKDASGLDYSIQSLAPLVSSVNIPILTRVSTSGTYTISAYDFKDFAMCVGLIDKLDNSYHDLRLSPHVFTISDTTSAPRFELVLCKDESLNTVGISEATESNSIFITQDAQGAYVKTVFEKNTKAIISVYNIIGQKLMKDVTVEGMVTNTALPIELHNQVVIIKVTTDKETVTKKMVLQ